MQAAAYMDALEITGRELGYNVQVRSDTYRRIAPGSVKVENVETRRYLEMTIRTPDGRKVTMTPHITCGMSVSRWLTQEAFLILDIEGKRFKNLGGKYIDDPESKHMRPFKQQFEIFIAALYKNFELLRPQQAAK